MPPGDRAADADATALLVMDERTPPPRQPDAEAPSPDRPFGDDARYRPGGEIGRGGLGRVIEADDRRLQRPVAVKELHERDFHLRFEREALITARLEHPAIVPIHDRGWRDGVPYYVMKRVHGQPLGELIAAAATPAARLALLEHLIAVCDAVGYAHSRGVIHRDLKPGNVLVGAFGETVVIDWGLAKELGAAELPRPVARSRSTGSVASVADGTEPTLARAGDVASADSTLTVAGSIMGTPGYMSPEQARGDEVDRTTDVYALGVMLACLLCGRRPDELTALGDAPPELAAIVRRATAATPADRYPDARAMGADLRQFLTGRLVSAHRYTLWQRLRRFARRHRAALIAAVVATAAIAASTVVAFRRVVAARDRMEVARDAEAARVVELQWMQAQAELDRDPGRSLGWLRRLADGGFTRWDQARVVAADALARGVGRVVADVGSALWGLEPYGDGYAVWTASGKVTAFDAAGRATELVRDGVDLNTMASTRDYLVIGDEAGAVRVVTGATITTTLHHREPVVATCAEPEGFAVGTTTALIVYAPSGQVQRRVSTPATVETIDRVAGGWVWTETSRVAFLGDDGAVRELWRGDAEIRSASLSPDGRQLALGLELAPRVVVVGVADGRVRELAGPVASRVNLAWRDDGARLYAVSVSPTLEWWSLASGERREVVLGAGSSALAWSGGLLYLGGVDGAVRITDGDGGSLAELHGHHDRVEALWVHGEQLVTASLDATVRSWDLAAIVGWRRDTGVVDVYDVAVIDDRRLGAAADPLTVIEPGGAAPRAVGAGNFLHVDAVRGAWLVGGTRDGEVVAWDVANARETGRVALGGRDPYVTGVVVTPDRTAVVVQAYDGRLQRRRLPDLGLEYEAHDASVDTVEFALAYAADGAHLITGNDDGSLRWRDPRTFAAVRRVDAEIPIRCLAVSADGRWVAAGGRASTIVVVEVATGARTTLRGHRDGVLTLAFAADGRLASGSNDGTVRVWDVASGHGRAIASGGRVSALWWSDDGRSIYAINVGGALRRIADDLPRGDALRAWVRASPSAVDVE